jgi:hypothetical protein
MLPSMVASGGASQTLRQLAQHLCAHRWSKNGALDRVFEKLQLEQIVRIKIEAFSLDSTIVKVHPDGTGALKKRTAVHRQIPWRMDHQDSSGCRECSNGNNSGPVAGQRARCALWPSVVARSGTDAGGASHDLRLLKRLWAWRMWGSISISSWGHPPAESLPSVWDLRFPAGIFLPFMKSTAPQYSPPLASCGGIVPGLNQNMIRSCCGVLWQQYLEQKGLAIVRGA